MLKKLDIYIIKKFLGTFFLAIAMIIVIAVVFDVSEKIDDFMEHNAPLSAIVFDYYCNFIPYFVNLFSPLFTFIAVILFTSKLAENSEIIAILSTGISFNRLVRPYMISAGLIAILTFTLSGYIIPPANAERLDFQEEYVKKKRSDNATKIQMEVAPGEILFIDYYDKTQKMGYRASLEKFDGKTLVSRITADTLVWDTLHNWSIHTYIRRDFDGMYEKMTKGVRIDTIIPVEPEEFFTYKGMYEQMKNDELKNYIEKQKSRGIGTIKEFEIEYEQRFSFPFAAFILTLIGVSLSSKKVKGGMGMNLGFGLLLSFSYILFYTVSSEFAVSGSLSPRLAVWLPNIVFSIIAAVLYRKAPK
ncbi:MAG: LptF/LptG family permease [Paludibacteraceae bacterium]|nr:LptF/LptG family permease [Paludibacteraceae bacterium]